MTEQSYYLPQEPVRFSPEDFDRVLGHCYTLGASDVTFQSSEPIFAEIQGRLHKVTRRALSNTEVGEILNHVYGPNGTTQLLGGHDVDTHYEYRPNRSQRFRFRVNGTGCQVAGHTGIQITFRVIPHEPPRLADLGLESAIVEAIAPLQGVVYVTGATGSGKSTLLAAIIRELAEQEESHRKILTYEAPIEFVYDTLNKPTALVCQSEIPRHLPTFAAGVRNALRRKPMAILVGEARDPETILSVIEAALTGHPVYTTLHSNGVAETIRRLVTSFPQEERNSRATDIIETIRLSIWQKLVPTVDGKRVALREFLVFDEKIRDRLLGSDPDQMTATTRQLLLEYGQPLLLDAERKLKDGLISKREFDILAAGTDTPR